MGSLFNLANLKKTYYYLRRNGIKKAIAAARERLEKQYYADYVYLPPKEEELKRQREMVWPLPLIFSILVPAYETREEYLRQLIASLLAQTYPHWELVLADATGTEKVKRVLMTYEDERIRYIRLDINGGISTNSNEGLKEVRGEYVGLLDHDDFLTPDALYEMAQAIEEGRKSGKEYAFLFSDEDKCNEEGKIFYDPHFKLAFNLDLFLTNNYICHFLVMKREIIQRLGFRKAYDGAQDYDLVLRAVGDLLKEEKPIEERICHLPKVLYHWRCHLASTAQNPGSKNYAYEAGRLALEDFVGMRGWKATVKHMEHVGFYRICYEGGIFAQRPDVAAVGGKIVSSGKIVGGIYDREGKALYAGLPLAYGGYMHRAHLAQNVEVLSNKGWKINPQLVKKIETFREESVSNTDRDEWEEQKRLCKTILHHGYRLYWDPEWIIRSKE